MCYLVGSKIIEKCIFSLSVHVVFGRVIDGETVVKQVESQKTDTNSRPLKDCTIVHCGELVLARKAKKKHSKLILHSCCRR